MHGYACKGTEMKKSLNIQTNNRYNNLGINISERKGNFNPGFRLEDHEIDSASKLSKCLFLVHPQNQLPDHFEQDDVTVDEDEIDQDVMSRRAFRSEHLHGRRILERDWEPWYLDFLLTSLLGLNEMTGMDQKTARH